ncbi:DUF1707 SHOCT-like domain-containing protein [Kribbella kalugense]|uniref:Uncharacterized protein DUF1707 n=1 Tax=Kribbella kalugense TaxID=2512221 RepID=A0A4R7ZCM7_9ACTN|nr:DUF1707 domain-containing protein [Kribbella kalugense]TDW14942.1 uncharacterized protein DUF1707 [Kribbella kalugense]
MSEEKPGGSIRIGDSEREDAVRRLGEHYEAGRLSAEEHSERVDQALRATTGADLDGLFADLPGAHQTAGAGQATAGEAASSGDGEGWAGPWGWRKPPWTAAENAAGSTGPGAGGGRGPGRPFGGQRPEWARRGFIGRVPLPLLIVLGVLAALASIGCVVGGGHPPFLPIVLIVAAVIVIRKRRMERRA